MSNIVASIDGVDVELTPEQALATFGPVVSSVGVASVGPISPRQFFVGMTKAPWSAISEAECAAMLTVKTIPATLVDAITLAETNDVLPAGMSRFDVEMLIIAATEFRYDNPVSQVVSTLLGWTEEERLAFWQFAATL